MGKEHKVLLYSPDWARVRGSLPTLTKFLDAGWIGIHHHARLTLRNFVHNLVGHTLNC